MGDRYEVQVTTANVRNGRKAAISVWSQLKPPPTVRGVDLEFYGLALRLPSDWRDITDDLPDGSPPTLAKPDGVGAIQFSIARHQCGEAPHVDRAALQNLLENFCARHGFDCHPQAEGHDNIQVVKSHALADGELVAIWYVSNGADVVLATYVSQQAGSDETDDEWKEAEAVIGSLRF